MVDREFGCFWGEDVFYLYRGCFEPLCRWLIRSLGGLGAGIYFLFIGGCFEPLCTWLIGSLGGFGAGMYFIFIGGCFEPLCRSESVVSIHQLGLTNYLTT